MNAWLNINDQWPEFPLHRMWVMRGLSNGRPAMVFESDYVLTAHNGFVGEAQAVLRVPLENQFVMFNNGEPKTVTAISCPLMWDGGEGDFDGVTHWMPLPEPPK